MEPQEAPQSVVSLVMKFFTIPLIIVLICVGIFYFFGTIAHEEKEVDDYLLEMKTGSANRRWQAAYELSKRMGQLDQDSEKRAKFVREMEKIYLKERAEEDPRLRRYVVLGLSGLAEKQSYDLFMVALADSDVDVQIYALWGLGALKNPKAIDVVLHTLKDEDPALRKVSSYVLGGFGETRVIPALKQALEDEVVDVQWNSALSLARLGDDSGRLVLHQMLDRSYLDRMSTLSELQKRDVMVNAIKGVVLLKDRTALPLLEALSQSEAHPDLVKEIRKGLDTLR